MEKIYDRLIACGVCPERAEMLMNYYITEGKCKDLEDYVIVLEMHLRGED